MGEISTKKDYLIITRLKGRPISKKIILFPLLNALIFLITTIPISTLIINITQMFSVGTTINNSSNVDTSSPKDDTVPRDDDSNVITYISTLSIFSFLSQSP